MASEVIALCQSFEQELSKILAILPPVSSSKPEVHDAHLNHHRISQRIAESVSYYAGRLPAYASVPRILSFGDKLFRLEQHQLALQACYKHVRSLSLHTTQENLPRLDALARLSSHVQACFGCAACEAALLVVADPQIKHPDTLQWLEQCLLLLRVAIALALPDERLYWLVLNGSVHVYTTAKVLITAGFSEQALPSLVFCIKAMEGHVCFAAPKFLPWRAQLYTWATYGLIDCKAYEQARALLADGLKRLDMLVALQKLDPVPVSPAVKAAFSTTRSTLLGLQLRVEVAAGAPVAPLLAQLTGGTAAAPPPTAAAPAQATPAATAPATPAPPSPEAQLTLQRSLVAMVEALHVPGRRIARCEPASGALKELFDTALATAGPLMQALRTALGQAAAAVASAAPAAGSTEAAAVAAVGGVLDGGGAGPDEAALAAVAAAAAAAQAAGEAFPFDVHRGLLCAAYNLEQWPQFDELATLATERSTDLTAGGVTALNEHQQQSQHPHQSAVGHAAGQLATVASLLLALRQLTTQPGVDALRQLASDIQQALTRGLPPPHPRGISNTGATSGTSPYNATNGSPNGAGTGASAGLAATMGAGNTGGITSRGGAGGGGGQHHAVQQQWQLVPRQQLRDLIADASLALYGSARPLIDGVFCAEDKEAGTVAELLAACHAAWSAVDLDDGQLRVGLALKLALLWEEDGQLAAAREVLLEAKSTVQRVRVELMSANRRAPDEHVRWITGSASQPSDDTAERVAAMTPSEQELACLHVDVLALLSRVELGLGVAEQQGRATARRGRLLVEQAQRAAQSRIFGERHPREVARDEARLAAASTTPPNPQVEAKERELLQACGKNPYERALVLMQMSAFAGSDTARKMQLLQEAGDLLAKAQAAEDSLFAAAQPDPRTGSRDTPLQPKLLQRTPTSVTLMASPPGPGQRISSRGRPPPTHYMAYCKAFGAGVGLSMNKTAMEYPGCGIKVPLGQPVTIQGLRTNDTYLFAVALYDDAGNLIGGLGTSTPEVLLALPLPLYMCWAHLLASAVRAGVGAVAKRAAGVLLPHFVKTSSDVPLWAANPMDAQRLHRAHVAATARPLLRAVVQSIYVYGGAALVRTAARPPPPRPPPGPRF